MYMGPVIWDNLPFLKSASSLNGFKNLYKRLLRNKELFFIEYISFFPVHYFLRDGEEYNFFVTSPPRINILINKVQFRFIIPQAN